MSTAAKPFKQYRVLEKFRDRDTKHVYEPGDIYPVKGKPKKGRVEELLSHPGHDYRAFIEEEIVQPDPPEELEQKAEAIEEPVTVEPENKEEPTNDKESAE